MKIDILTDNPNSWIIKYIPEIIKELAEHDVSHHMDSNSLEGGDILCVLSCEKILKRDVRIKYKSSVVAHPSRLPQGKGWSPVAWQIIEGKNKIPISLIEAEDKVDSGCIYFQEDIFLNGSELNDEVKAKQFAKTKELIKKYIDNYPVIGKIQNGADSYYRRFSKEDNKLDVNKSIKEQFNLLRIVDNDRFPAWFEYLGNIYHLKINKK